MLIFMLVIAVALNASAQLIFDFEGETVGQPPSGWTTSGNTVQVINDPTGSGRGKVLSVSDKSNNGAATYTAYQLPSGFLTGNGSLEMDIYGVNISNRANVSWWLATGNAGGNARRAGFGYDVPNPSFEWYTFDYNTQKEFDQTANFSGNAWYTVRISVDVNTDTYQIFAKGGAFGSNFVQLSTGNGTLKTWPFRNGPVTELTHIWFSSFLGNYTETTDGMYVDNITVIPEPSSIMLGVMAVALGVGIRRIRRMAA